MAKRSKKEKTKINTKVAVYNFLEGKEIKNIDLDEKIFDGKVNKALLHQVSVMYQASRRAGTASTRTRGEVRGGGKKPWRQKGTGRARAGSIRSPLWKGGGATFGPHPRDYSYSVSRKARNLAVKSVLNGKLLDSELFFISEIKMEQPKTKIFAAALKKFLKARNPRFNLDDFRNTSVMVVVDKPDVNLKRASANIPRLLLTDSDNFTALDVLLHKNLIVSEQALVKIYKRIK